MKKTVNITVTIGEFDMKELSDLLDEIDKVLKKFPLHRTDVNINEFPVTFPEQVIKQG